jgi:hypothetical protein
VNLSSRFPGLPAVEKASHVPGREAARFISWATVASVSMDTTRHEVVPPTENVNEVRVSQRPDALHDDSI